MELFKEKRVKFFALDTMREALAQRVEDARCKAKPKSRPQLIAVASDDEDEPPITPVRRILQQSTIKYSSSVS